jgi:hypothetical protein
MPQEVSQKAPIKEDLAEGTQGIGKEDVHKGDRSGSIGGHGNTGASRIDELKGPVKGNARRDS